MEMHRIARDCNSMIFFWHLSGTGSSPCNIRNRATASHDASRLRRTRPPAVDPTPRVWPPAGQFMARRQHTAPPVNSAPVTPFYMQSQSHQIVQTPKMATTLVHASIFDLLIERNSAQMLEIVGKPNTGAFPPKSRTNAISVMAHPVPHRKPVSIAFNCAL